MPLIGKISRDTKIYRILDREYFFELFEKRQNSLVLPRIWSDKFENVVQKAEVRTASGEKVAFRFHDKVYGQCWTLHKASDAMWQIYSRKKDAVRVRTTIGKLIDTLHKIHGEWAYATCFVGKVDYLTEAQLREYSRTIFRSGITPEAIARSLLIKRKAYKHENEVRLVYIDRENDVRPGGIYKYDIEPNNLIEQAMIDPRVPYEEFIQFKMQVMKSTGLTKNQVKLSLLYRQPKDFVVEIP